MSKRLRDLARTLRKLGFTVEEPSKGSHWKVYARDGRMHPIPAHNGTKTEIAEKYLRKLAEFCGIDRRDLDD